MKPILYIIGGRAGQKLIHEYMKSQFDTVVYKDLDIDNLNEDTENIVSEMQGNKNSVWIPGVGDNLIRCFVCTKMGKRFRHPINCIHESATIAQSAVIGNGNLISPGVIINPGARIGDGCIINTGAIIEHDCVIEDFAQIGPGVSMAGYVTVKTKASIWTGASLIPHVIIGEEAVVGAGSVVTKHVYKRQTVMGVPAK